MKALPAILAASAVIALAQPAEARHRHFHHSSRHHHYSRHEARSGHQYHGGALSHVRLLDGQMITVASSVASKFEGFLNALFKREGRLPHIGCYSPTGHVRNSLHHWGGACDVGQSRRNVAWRAMYHVGALAASYGLTDGCIWRHPDCGHVDVSGTGSGRHYAGRERHQHYARRSRHHRYAIVTPQASPGGTAVASWYGTGQRTASGERFNPNGMTFASRTLPFGTEVEFSYRGRSVIARSTDRGPFVRGRQFDLSRGAARRLGMDGVATVQWRVVGR